MWWRDMNVKVCSFSVHHIEVDVCNSDSVLMWKAVGVYGWPETEYKYKTWDLMRRLKEGAAVPMLCFGDFNEIVGMNEKSGGVVREERLMDAFRGALDDCGFRDLGYKGSIYTWQRGNSMETLVRERLDRYVADSEWCALFQSLEVIHLPMCHSDHAPILLKYGDRVENNRSKKLFRFEALWISSDECGKVVGDAWNEEVAAPITDRIVVLEERLKKWAGKTFGDLKKKIQKTESNLRELQGGRMDTSTLQQCQAVSSELNELRRMEESYWYSRSRVTELRDGDKNTKYFHHKASQQRKKNTITGLFDGNGVWQSSSFAIDSVISQYFDELFTSDQPVDFDGALAGIEIWFRMK
uniref:Uncharacterized protein n=1 Tax=Chenopodium quinoa TaxID=63459 RepID=A0A803MN05_CHEQI